MDNMKFYRTGEFQEDILAREIEVEPLKWIEKEQLKRLDYLLGYIKRNHPEKLLVFVENLNNKYKNLLTNIGKEGQKIDFGINYRDFSNLQEFPILAEGIVSYIFKTLGLVEDYKTVENKTKVLNSAYLKSFLHPRYFNLETLIMILERKEAINFYKKFGTQYLIDTQTPEEPFIDLETLLEKRITNRQEPPSAWVMLHGMLAEGKYAYRNDNCLWVNVLQDLPDKEIKYYVCCYGDYQAAKSYYNENIILTMEHTIAQGDPYCSRVLHDTRIDWDLRHPPKKFWDELKSNK
ncbi:MAG TPA: L-2-amino-thiazoline-4-carboxylic acid hydrolase [Candidatus Bathyarchaeia archaeon]|nr:L-2-amino-thiazoline-4-carboxylic acid hydrolase [Candidatus Bathyarchaeia archaeon]